MELAVRLANRLTARANELDPPVSEAEKLRAYDPIGFAREVLKFQPWSRQREIFEAVAKCQRVACVSGHKVGKSTALAALALWFYCTFRNARVVITATTDNQVNGIIWREIRRLVRRAARSGFAIPGADRIGQLARTGLTDPTTDSEIRGYTAGEAEAIAGVSGAHILYLVDEASGVADFIFEAIEGNRAGGNAWVFLISNPTRAEGEFYNAFHSKSSDAMGTAGYHNIHIDSRESPNITGEWRELEEWDEQTAEWSPRSSPVPGLAVQSWVDEKARDWGTDSALFKIRVAGVFSVAEEAKIFGADLLAAMVERWESTEASGRLYIGVDPAGDGDGGDESGFAARRGSKAIELRTRSGLSPEAHIAIVQDMITAAVTAGCPRSPVPVVNVESEGDAGWKVYLRLKEHAERTGEFVVSRMRTSSKAIREPLIYDRIRDEVWACARRWAREGGSIPQHTKLERDLHAPEFHSDIRGRLKVTPKKDLKKLLGRSPDIGDALVLSTWEPLAMRQEDRERESPQARAADVGADLPELNLDPYSSGDWSRGPY